MHGKCGLDQRLLIGTRLFQMMQQLKLLFDRRALGALGKHGVQVHHVRNGELTLLNRSGGLMKPGDAVLACM